MRVAMAMTAASLIRALRWKAHDLAEEAERAYADDASTATSRRGAHAETDRNAWEQSNERAGG